MYTVQRDNKNRYKHSSFLLNNTKLSKTRIANYYASVAVFERCLVVICNKSSNSATTSAHRVSVLEYFDVSSLMCTGTSSFNEPIFDIKQSKRGQAGRNLLTNVVLKYKSSVRPRSLACNLN